MHSRPQLSADTPPPLSPTLLSPSPPTAHDDTGPPAWHHQPSRRLKTRQFSPLIRHQRLATSNAFYCSTRRGGEVGKWRGDKFLCRRWKNWKNGGIWPIMNGKWSHFSIIHPQSATTDSLGESERCNTRNNDCLHNLLRRLLNGWRYTQDGPVYNQCVKKTFGETQTLRAGCSKAEPKKIRPAADPFPGARDGQNLISWRWSLPSPTDPVWWKSMHAISRYRGKTHKQTHAQKVPITIQCAAKLSAQCSSSWIYALTK